MSATMPSGGGPRSPDRQVHGRNLIAALHMLVRSVKLYDPQNAVFHKPLQAMIEAMTGLAAEDGKVELAVVNGSFYVNSQLIRVDQASLELLRSLAEEMEERGVGGFSCAGPPPLEDLRNFVAIFAVNQQRTPGEDGLPGRELRELRLSRFGSAKERLDAVSEDVDPRAQAITIYARAVFFMQAQEEALRAGRPASAGTAVRLGQDLIDAFVGQEALLLSCMQNGTGGEAPSFHLVNSALIAIAFGRALGLSRVQQKDVALGALWCELGMWRVPAEGRLSAAPEELPQELRAQRIAATLERAAAALSEPNAGRPQHLKALTAVSIHVPFHKVVTDAQGQRTYQPRRDSLYSARIVALCTYFETLTAGTRGQPACSASQALEAMWQQRWRFDPDLCAAFVRVMAQKPVKVRAGPA
jgi:hypothetical protein